jgi:hypothetical protein
LKTRPNGTILVETILSISPKRHPKFYDAILKKPDGVAMAKYICFLVENGISENGFVVPIEQEADLSSLAEEI